MLHHLGRFHLLLALAATSPAQQAASRPASPPARSAEAAGMLQGISEEEFKKMHELRTDQPPPLKGHEIKIGADRAYLSLPPGKKAPLPGVIVIHEWWGLNEHIEHWCDRLAALGYAALGVDLYGGQVAKNRDDAMKYMQAVKTANAVVTLRAAHAFLEKDDRVQATKTAAIGWCFGGAMSLRAGLEIADLDAVVMYYGRPVTDVEELRKLKAPLLGIFGNRDGSIPPKAVDEFVAALAQAGHQPQIHRYDAEHAFANPSSKAYDQQNAEAAYAVVVKFLAERLR